MAQRLEPLGWVLLTRSLPLRLVQHPGVDK